MHPVLFRLGRTPIYTYSVLLDLGLLCGLAWAWWHGCRRFGREAGGWLVDAFLAAVVGGLLGFFLLSALPVLLAFSEEVTGAALTGTATSMLLLLGNAGGVVVTLAMEAIKGATGGPEGSFFWAMVFLSLAFLAALLVAFRLREEGTPGKAVPPTP